MVNVDAFTTEGRKRDGNFDKVISGGGGEGRVWWGAGYCCLYGMVVKWVRAPCLG